MDKTVGGGSVMAEKEFEDKEPRRHFRARHGNEGLITTVMHVVEH